MNNSVGVLKVMDEYEDLLDFAALHYGAWIKEGAGAFSPSEHVVESLQKAKKARAAVANLIEAAHAMSMVLNRNGEHDEGCFYYYGLASPELDGPLSEIDSALSQVRGLK